MRSVKLLVGSLMITFSLNSMAQGPCRGDVEKFCKDVEPGEGRIAQCLKANESSLTAGCREHAKTMKEERKEMHKEMREKRKAMHKEMREKRKESRKENSN